MKKGQKKFLLFLLVIIVLTVLSGAVLFWYSSSSETVTEPWENLFVDDSLYAKEIAAAAAKYDLPPLLVRALIKKESRFDPKTRGKAGEVGLMQVLPSGAVADWARVNKVAMPSVEELSDVSLNLEIGCWYLSRKMKKWEKYRYGMELALAEYNAGGKNSARWKPETLTGEVIPRIDFPTTKKYVIEIMHNYREYLIESKK